MRRTKHVKTTHFGNHRSLPDKELDMAGKHAQPMGAKRHPAPEPTEPQRNLTPDLLQSTMPHGYEPAPPGLEEGGY